VTQQIIADAAQQGILLEDNVFFLLLENNTDELLKETPAANLYQGISADANYPDWIEFYSAKYVSQGDPLYVQTQLTLGYTSEQMQTLFDLALQEPA
jgi:hypothetical protein